jgi:hypothetical protein
MMEHGLMEKNSRMKLKLGKKYLNINFLVKVFLVIVFGENFFKDLFTFLFWQLFTYI